MIKEGLPYNWNKHEGVSKPVRIPQVSVEIDDETWRDGMQGTQVGQHPRLAEKLHYLNTTARLSLIDHADIGFPGSGPKHRKQISEIVQFVQQENLPLTLSAAARGAAMVDIQPIIAIADKYHYPLEADIFFDASALRARVEGWDRAEKFRKLEENIKKLKKAGLPIMVVPERATSTSPKELYEICLMAADLGVERICIPDTQGIATHKGVQNIFRWAFEELGTSYPDLKWDFHGHNDLGLGLSNCLIAADEGVDRVHATAFCVGERAGNVDLAQLAVLLNLQGLRSKGDISRIQEYVDMASKILKTKIPDHTPIIGNKALETASGVHGSAYMKERQSEEELPNIYFAYPPEAVGKQPSIRVGPMSGINNVRGYAQELQIEINDEVALKALAYAKEHWAILDEKTFRRIVSQANRESEGSNR